MMHNLCIIYAGVKPCIRIKFYTDLVQMNPGLWQYIPPSCA